MEDVGPSGDLNGSQAFGINQGTECFTASGAARGCSSECEQADNIKPTLAEVGQEIVSKVVDYTETTAAEARGRSVGAVCVRDHGTISTQGVKLRPRTDGGDVAPKNVLSDPGYNMAAGSSIALSAGEDRERVSEVKHGFNVSLPPVSSTERKHQNLGQLRRIVQHRSHQRDIAKGSKDQESLLQGFDREQLGKLLQQCTNLPENRSKCVDDIGEPSCHKPSTSLVNPFSTQNTCLIAKKGIQEKLFADSRAFQFDQSERHRQEYRQQQIQQWVLKHNFSQDSLPSECWPGQYPQISSGGEGAQGIPQTMHKVVSNKVEGIVDSRRQESSSTQSLFEEPPVHQVLQMDPQQPVFKSSKAAIDTSGTVDEFEGSVKRRKLDTQMPNSTEEGAPHRATEPCYEKFNSTAVVAGLDVKGMPMNSDLTLRQWLSKPGRVVDRFECLHIFKQILEFVEVTHSQGIILKNVRPSSFVLSSLHRVSYLDSGSSRSSSGSSEPSTGTDSIQASRLDRASPDDITFIQNERKPLSAAEAMAQQGSQFSSEEEFGKDGSKSKFYLDQATERVANLHRGSRTGGGVLGWQSGSLRRTSLSSQWSGSSCLEWSGDIRTMGDAYRGIPSSQNSLAAGKFDKNEDLMIRNASKLSEEKYEGDVCFPVRQTLVTEETWYASPEELLDGACSHASDMYSLGVLFFELLCPFSSWEEHSRIMSDLHHRILPPRLLLDRPKEAAFCLWLLHPEPNSRPKARDVLHSELLSEVGEVLAERQAAMNIEEKEAETELILDFLLQLQQQKQQLVSKLLQDVSCLTSDIEEVKRRRALLQDKGVGSVAEDQDRSSKLMQDARVSRISIGSKDLLARDFSVQKERKNPQASKWSGESSPVVSKQEMPGNIQSSRRREDVRSKSARLMSNFDQLEQVYLSMRWKLEPQASDTTKKHENQKQDINIGHIASGKLDVEGKKLSEANNKGTKEKDWLGCFFDSLCKYARYSRFEVKATLRHGDLLNTANMVCSLSFDRDQEYFATAGVCKRIKVFECDSVLNENVDIHYPVVEMSSRSKLSFVCWNSYIKSHIASSDYDGVVQLWDASTGQSLMRYQEHEKRVWSVDFSQADPTKLASGSDDRCVKLWSINQEGSIGMIKTKANICCVQFPPDSAHLIAFGSADYKIYCYDLRNTKNPRCTLINHTKAVSYVKFVDAVTLVSASTDNTLRLWDLSKSSSAGGVIKDCLLTYTGHTNEKNFVGLSVMDGYIACGSETNAVFAYHKSLPMPMASHKFGSADPLSGEETEDDSRQFVSSVCWRGKSQTLVAANSMGSIKVLEMV